jgi:diaminohydroxyphosphoribosylaminopyrimidine deaminase / 5-amino-6-(5-phosphoribosylamino)uracil reductase
METDIFYMRRCLQLAQLGAGYAAPNPMVGAVIVKNGQVIGQGYHKKCGGPHAEVNAAESVKDKSLIPGSTIYVSLEPCAHYGRTPPCAEMIARLKFGRCVVACADSFAKVNGRGIEIMRNAGIKVDTGVLEEEAMSLNRRFFTFHKHKRPYIILKWAQTADGFIDISQQDKKTQRGQWITNQAAKQLVHKWRSQEAAIIAGTNTLTCDNPALNVREWAGKSPVRIIPDRQGRLPAYLEVFKPEADSIVYTACSKAEYPANAEKVLLGGTDFMQRLLHDMYLRGLNSLFVEGGADLHNWFIENNLWDEARVFTGPKWFGRGLAAPVLNAKPAQHSIIEDVGLFTFFNYKHSK